MTTKPEATIEQYVEEILSETVSLRRHLRQHVGPEYKFQPGPQNVHGYKVGACVFPPDEYKPYWTICTVGMSSIAMAQNPSADSFSELLLSLPSDWDWSDAKNSWPLTLLWTMTDLIASKKNKTFLNGQVIRAKGANIPIFSSTDSPAGGVCFKNPSLLTEKAWQMDSEDGLIKWLAVVPIFMQEIDFVEKHGESEVFDKLADYEVTELFDRRRVNTCFTLK